MFNRRFDLPHLYVVLHLSLPNKLDNLILDLTLITILALLLKDNIPIEDILAFRTHHTHLAHQMMRDILHLRHFCLVDDLRVMVLFLHLHLLISADHRLDFELLWKFYLQSLVARLWDV